MICLLTRPLRGRVSKSISREVENDATFRLWQDCAIVRTIRSIPLLGPPMNLRKLLSALLLLSLPAMAQAADITGVPKIREGDQMQIGSHRIRLGGIDAPSVDQLCLNTSGERWTCGVAARDELIKRFGGKSWTCQTRTIDRRGRTVARCSADGEDIQKWLVSNGWALAYRQFSRDYEADEKAAREAKAGMWHGAFIAPWDWRARNKKTTILGAAKPPENASTILLASASGPSAPSPDCTIKGNVNRAGECIFHQPTSRWYAKIEMKISKGTRWFCSVEEAEAAGCRETRR
jgi:endonuclease YncB( thermonuclease family)